MALGLAMVTKRLFLLDWPSDPYPLSTALYPHLIDWTIPPSVTRTFLESLPKVNWFFCPQNRPKTLCPGAIPPTNALPVIDAPNLIDIAKDDVISAFKNHKSFSIACRLRTANVNLLIKNPYNAKRFSDLQPETISPVSLQRKLRSILFRPSKNLLRVMSRAVPTAFKQGYVGLHIRSGIDFEEPHDRFKDVIKDLNGTTIAIFSCALRLASNIKQIFAATDSIEAKVLLAQLAQRHGFGFKTTKTPAIHFGLVSAADRLSRLDENDRLNAFLGVFADMLVMSEAKIIFTTGSGLAQNSFWMGNATALVTVETVNGKVKCLVR